MTVNIKDNCTPWENDPGKFYLTCPGGPVPISTSLHCWVRDFTFGRKVHITNLKLAVASTMGALSTGVCTIGVYKGTTTASGIAITLTGSSLSEGSSPASGAVSGTTFKGTETEVEFLATDAVKVIVKSALAKAGKVTPIIEFEIA